MKKVLNVLILLLLSIPVLAAADFSSLEEQMTGKEYAAAGLDKLSPSELSALNAWIRDHSLGTLSTVAAVTDTAAADDEEKDKDKKRNTITGTLVGKFSGWDGQTVFKLQDGSIWVQADKDKFHIKEVENPTVVIEPGMFGSWHLSIEGHDSECRVKKIQ
ncbi:MAG: hypothetical protein HKN57_14090 [Xanthomonadales bacterium]|nr:hypothetical protein [Gammaproteobacteria bacterium]MBT8055139.1 hypothetical protein [Gammaproteobacteria bacterium]NND58372.1 hypothetical protein [Xanthomonadales bacterium]NNK51733.1 hypothetical protein [Xanthomonadales bacterium]